MSRRFGARGSLRADLLIRNYVDFYMRQADTATGHVQDPTGRAFNLALITNAPDGLLARDYAGGTFTGTYRFGTTVDIGGNYTISKASGNFDAENVASGPVPFDYRYPGQAGLVELPGRRPGRRSASSRAALDQLQPGVRAGIDGELLQAIESGVPYGAVNTNGVDPRPFVTNPNNAYLNPACLDGDDLFLRPARRVPYRGPESRTDLAFNYNAPDSRREPHKLFAQAQVLNVLINSSCAPAAARCSGPAAPPTPAA